MRRNRWDQDFVLIMLALLALALLLFSQQRWANAAEGDQNRVMHLGVMDSATYNATMGAASNGDVLAYNGTIWSPESVTPHDNYLINPGFFINQRAYVSGNATTAANQYTLDRWRVVTSGQSVSWTDSGGVRTVTAPAGGLEQVIEGTWLPAGTYTISWTGNATCTVDSTSRTSGESFSISGGSNITVSFINGTVSHPKFEIGIAPTLYQERQYGVELTLCQRYFERLFPGANGRICFAYAYSTTQAEGLMFYALKRTSPSVSRYGYFQWVCGGTSASMVNFGVSGANVRNALIYDTGLSGLTVGLAGYFRTHPTTGGTAYIDINAEL